ncbi:MAG: very short patch repair endonuclease [Hyphomicrobium sp.]
MLAPFGRAKYTMDTVNSRTRSRMMSAVKGRDTQPERTVRRVVHAAGYRFRLHHTNIPGRPDLVLPRFKVAVFVHGCFWHGHTCIRGKRPTSNTEFWNAKIEGNIARDQRTTAAVKAAGWKHVVVWECSLARDTQRLLALLARRDRRTKVSTRKLAKN